MVKRIPLLSLALLLAACTTVGPNFQAPAAPAGAWRTGDAGAQATLPVDWWTIYGDATLDRLERQAQDASPTVQASAARLVQAQAQLATVGANAMPGVNAGVSVANTRTSSTTSQGLALGGRSIEGNQYTAGVSLSYELDLWGKVRRAVEAADALVLAARYDIDGVRLLLAGQVATTYWQLRGLDAEVAVLRTALAARREAAQLVQARFDAGLTNELDVSRFYGEADRAEADLLDAQRLRDGLEHGLAVLVGAQPGQFALAPLPAASLPAAPVVPAGLPAALLAQRPDLAASVEQLRSLNAQVGVATAAFYPSITLTGNFGYASESLSRLFEPGSRQFSAGPLGLSIPLFDAGRNRDNLKLARARYDEAAANHRQRVLTALREVDDALSDIESRDRQLVILERSRQHTARDVEVARRRYELGVATYIEVTEAMRGALAAERAQAQARTQRLLSVAALARALGGGWQPPR
jgi:multidrug efflux system outer membrane protein